MKENFRDEYLSKKLEPPRNNLLDKVNVENTQISDYEEFGEHSYTLERGRFEFKIGDTKIILDYDQPPLEDIIGTEDSLLGFDQSVPLEDFESSEEFKPYLKMLTDIRIIKKLVLDNGKECLDTSEVFADENQRGKIYFNFHEQLGAFSNIDIENLKICIKMDPLTPMGLAHILHEIGHYQDSQTYDRQEYILRNKISYPARNFINDPLAPVDTESASLALEDERKAWAFALNNLRPFSKDLKLKLDGLDSLIHGHCLQSYSDSIRLALENQDILTLLRNAISKKISRTEL
ncbi:MAG: hypothetical protein QY321_01285 [Patescibacteria group bacterium]|nr:MAG: hypothetical protein QY321_01285 [Patescibacteria group bacterium]